MLPSQHQLMVTNTRQALVVVMEASPEQTDLIDLSLYPRYCKVKGTRAIFPVCTGLFVLDSCVPGRHTGLWDTEVQNEPCCFWHGRFCSCDPSGRLLNREATTSSFADEMLTFRMVGTCQLLLCMAAHSKMLTASLVCCRQQRETEH